MKTKRSNYSKDNLTNAVNDYRNGSTSTEVTAKYGVPGSTVRNHNSNSKLKIGGGRPTLLTNHQEHYFVELLKNLESVGIRLTKPVVMKLSSEYVQYVTGK
jgi:transposase